MFSVSGTTTSSSTKMLVLPEQQGRSSLFFQNLSSATMFLEIGCGEATATVSGGAITAITGVNNGFNYTFAPDVLLFGGGAQGGNTTFVGCGSPGYASPGESLGTAVRPTGKRGSAHCTVSGGSINSYIIDDPGSGYVVAPWVLLVNVARDPNGVADPSTGGGSGIELVSGASMAINSTVCTTSPVAVYCGTSGSRWQCKFTF